MRWIPDSGTLEPWEIISQGEALSVDCAIQPAGLTATAQSSLDPIGLSSVTVLLRYWVRGLRLEPSREASPPGLGKTDSILSGESGQQRSWYIREIRFCAETGGIKKDAPSQ